jgi:hypothetical protein
VIAITSVRGRIQDIDELSQDPTRLRLKLRTAAIAMAALPLPLPLPLPRFARHKKTRHSRDGSMGPGCPVPERKAD